MAHLVRRKSKKAGAFNGEKQKQKNFWEKFIKPFLMYVETLLKKALVEVVGIKTNEVMKKIKFLTCSFGEKSTLKPQGLKFNKVHQQVILFWY